MQLSLSSIYKFLSHKSISIHFFSSVSPLTIQRRKLYLCPRYSSFHRLMWFVNSLLCHILSRTSLFIILWAHEIFRSLLHNYIWNASTLFMSFVSIQVLQLQKRIDQTCNFTKFSLKLKFLLVNNVLKFINIAPVCSFQHLISSLRSNDCITQHPRCLNFCGHCSVLL